MTTTYDNAVEALDDDILGRWPVARSIAQLIETSKEKTVQVGILGEWGTGKTSLLNLLDAELDRLGLTAVRFSAFGLETLEDVFSALISAMRATAANHLGFIETTRGLEDSAKLTKALTKDVGGLAGVVGAFIAKKLQGISRDLADLEVYLREKEKRLVILVDDLDRTKGLVVQDLMYVLHEALSPKGFSFVVAFDESAVLAGLQRDYPKLNSSLDYLEKHLHFVHVLEEPTNEQISRMMQRDAAKNTPFVPTEIFNEVAECLPQSPRMARRIVRALMMLKPQLARHDAGEINWKLLLMIEVLRVIAPEVLTRVLADERLQMKLAVKLSGEKSMDEELSAFSHGDEEKKVRVKACVRLLEQLHALPQNFVYHASLMARPHAVTQQEYMQAQLVARKGPEEFLRWCEAHGKSHAQTVTAVRDELVFAALRNYEANIERSARSAGEQRLERFTALAREDLKTLSVILVTPGEWRNPEPVLEIRKVVGRWAHFGNHWAHRMLRAEERDVFALVTRLPGLSTVHVLRLLEIATRERGDQRPPEVDPILHAMVARARAELQTADPWTKEDAVNAMYRDATYRTLFFDADFMESHEKLVMPEIDVSELVIENARDFLDILMPSQRAEMYSQLSEEQRGTLIKVPGLVIRLWDWVTSQPCNPRSLGSLMGYRTVSQKHGITLAEPEWWDGVQQLLKEPA